MEDTSATLIGECSPWPSREHLVSLLRAAGLEPRVGTYSVRVRGDLDFAFSFEHYGKDICEPTIAADAVDAAVMIRGGKLVSAALAAAGVPHRFEIHDCTDTLVEYLHHKWPMP